VNNLFDCQTLSLSSRAELDATHARLYGLTRDELRYTPFGVDPKEVHGADFPGETFRVVKEEIRH